MLNAMIRVISDLKVNSQKIRSNIDLTKGQIYAEFVLEALVKKGVARFEAYRDIQRVAFAALESGEQFFDAVEKDKSLARHITRQELKYVFKAENHLAASAKIIDNVAKMAKKIG
jgi:adenylosuccinate lyase